MNVILGANGPVIIDWTNASRGHASFDAATTYAISSAFRPPRRVLRLGQRMFVESFAINRGRSMIRAALADAVRYRLTDPAVTDDERTALERLLASSRR